MGFLEKDLQEIIFDTLNNSYCGINKLEERGLETVIIDEYYKVFKELHIGNYGYADLVLCQRIDSHIYIYVFELKRNIINGDSLIQLYKYCKGIEDYLKYRKVKFTYSINAILIGKKETFKDNAYLLNYLKNLSIYLYNYNIDGLEFELQSNGYSLINKGFEK